jgi:glycosyltransferase involved in cell wall biosynthesis
MLTVCMIVKNEEACLPAALASVKGVDEIVVVDTGSTDRTVEIAAAAGANLFSFPWCDDFSAARNYAIRNAEGDWILFLDADEVLLDSVDLVKDYCANAPAELQAWDVRLTNGYGIDHWYPRLFRRSPDIRYQGRIHECINATRRGRCEITIHYGSSPAHAEDPDRNMRLLIMAVRDDPDCARHRYYLAREYWYKGLWGEADTQFMMCIKLSDFIPEKADALLYRARCLMQLQRGSEARDACLQAIHWLPDFAEAHRYMAKISAPERSAPWQRFASVCSNENVLFIRKEETA